MMTMKGIHCPKGNIHQFYLHWSKDGKGIIDIEETHNCECAALAKYMLNSTDPLTQMVQNTLTPMQKCLLKFALSPNFMSPELKDNNLHRCLENKPLHGKVFCQQKEIPLVDLA
eukprot:11512161-Ditylum_brightwellii.AAC.1